MEAVRGKVHHADWASRMEGGKSKMAARSAREPSPPGRFSAVLYEGHVDAAPEWGGRALALWRPIVALRSITAVLRGISCALYFSFVPRLFGMDWWFCLLFSDGFHPVRSSSVQRSSCVSVHWANFEFRLCRRICVTIWQGVCTKIV